MKQNVSPEAAAVVLRSVASFVLCGFHLPKAVW